jgi:DNA polymerase I-like protein with 3'-5' exonuclease and polymerase domains
LAVAVAAALEVVIDLETNSLDHRTGEIVGLGLAVDDRAYYVPIAHRGQDGKLLARQLVLSEVLQALQLHEKPLIAHNAKFELKWLRHHGQADYRFAWDTMLAASLLRSDLPSNLKQVALRELDVPDWGLPQEQIQTVQTLPVDLVAAYCAKDCVYTHNLHQKQQTCLV